MPAVTSTPRPESIDRRHPDLAGPIADLDADEVHALPHVRAGFVAPIPRHVMTPRRLDGVAEDLHPPTREVVDADLDSLGPVRHGERQVDAARERIRARPLERLVVRRRVVARSAGRGAAGGLTGLRR